MNSKGQYVFYMYDKYDHPIFEITIKDRKLEYKDVACDFVVRKIISWEEDKKPYDFEDYMELTIKWDSCSHLYFGDTTEEGRDSYLHFCGAQAFKDHIKLLHTLYNRAFKEMGREPYDKDEIWETIA